MARLLRRLGLPRAWFALAALTLSAGALIGATGGMADPAFSTTTPIAFPGENTCVFPSESFVGSGNLHLLVSGNSSTGGTSQSHVEANLQGVQAVTVTGKKYVVIDSSTETFVFDTPDLAPFHHTMEFTLQFVRQGEDGVYIMGDDFYEHFLAHVTVNANGLVTVDDLSDDTHCK